MIRPSDYRPAAWLRNAHVQSILASSPSRRWRAARDLQACNARHSVHDIDAGDGTRLRGIHSQPAGAARALALLLHGWEGSAESGYMRATAAQLLQRNIAVFRLNFRDHGDTHHLNTEPFHSNRIDEVVHAACRIAERFAGGPLLAAGYSLGGNFALRLALRAPQAGLPLARVAAVCPVIDPAHTMDAMERALPIYLRYFERKWTGSLRRKQALFPEQVAIDAPTLRLGMRELTAWMVQRHTDFDSLQDYFDGYSIAGTRLSALQLPADILMAKDDPVIPFADFQALQLPPQVQLEVSEHGGHCGFLLNARLDGHAERWVADRLLQAVH